jgi:lipopolysaccharide export system permease protein
LKVSPHRKLLNQVTLYVFDPDFHLRSRMDAPQVTWNGSEWVTRKGTEWTFDHSGSIVEERKFQGPFPFTIPLEEIIDVEKRPIDMGYRELRDYIRILKRKGYASINYEVDLYTKLSYSVIALVMVLIAIPFSLKTNRRGGVALSIGLGLGIGFFFWMAFSVGVSLGHAGHLDPMLGAWLVNFLVGAGALYGVFRIRY